MTEARSEDIHRYSASSIAAGVHLLYAVSFELEADPEARDEIPEETAAEVGEIMRAQGASDDEVDAVLDRVAAGLAEIAAGRAREFSKEAYDSARDFAVAGREKFGISGHRIWPPTSQTVRKRLGSNYWNDALSALGYPVSSRGRSRGAARYTPEQFVDAVVDFLADAREAGGATSFAGYEAWRGGETEAGRTRPSGAGLRAHFGSWQAAKKAAEAVAGD